MALTQEQIETLQAAATIMAAEHSGRAADLLETAMLEVAGHTKLSGPQAEKRWTKALRLLGDTCHMIARWQA